MEEFETGVNVEEVADLSIDTEVTSEVAETTEEPSTATAETPAPSQQSAEENSKYAEARRQAETKAKALEAQNNRLLEALGIYGYEGSPEEIADQIMAQSQGIPVEEAQAQREQREQIDAEKLQAQSEAEYYKNIAMEKLMADDLAKINSVYPDVKSLQDLGPEFISVLGATKDPLLAYEVINAKKQRETKPVPQDIGAVNSSSAKEKDFYTSAEVDKLTSKDLDNPKIMERVMKSMTRWK